MEIHFSIIYIRLLSLQKQSDVSRWLEFGTVEHLLSFYVTANCYNICLEGKIAINILSISRVLNNNVKENNE